MLRNYSWLPPIQEPGSHWSPWPRGPPVRKYSVKSLALAASSEPQWVSKGMLSGFSEVEFPGSSNVCPSQRESACQCMRCKRLGFNCWVGKILWSRKWQPTPIFLPGKFHGERSLMGYSPWGCKESDMTEHHSLIRGAALRGPWWGFRDTMSTKVLQSVYTFSMCKK